MVDVAFNFDANFRIKVKRLMWKPWQSDPFLKETFATIVKQKNSACRLIYNSHVFRDIFKRKISLDVTAPFSTNRVRNLQSALHRLDLSVKIHGKSNTKCTSVRCCLEAA